MSTKQNHKFIPLNEVITDFTEFNGSHYNKRVPNFTLLPTRKFVKFDGAKIIAKLIGDYNMDGKVYTCVTYGYAVCDPDNKYTKGFGIDLAFRKASEELERQCKQRLIAYSKDHMRVSKKRHKHEKKTDIWTLTIIAKDKDSLFDITFKGIKYEGLLVYKSRNTGLTYKINLRVDRSEYLLINIASAYDIFIGMDHYKIVTNDYYSGTDTAVYEIRKT